MSDNLTYKKISDLEKVNSVGSNATIPVLDDDGIMKQVVVNNIGGSNISKPLFVISGMYDSQKCVLNAYTGTPVSIEEAVDAAFGGGGMYLRTMSGTSASTLAIQNATNMFVISNDSIGIDNNYIFLNSTIAKFRSAMEKYLPEGVTA